MKKSDKNIIIIFIIIITTTLLLNIYAKKIESLLIKYTYNYSNDLITKVIDECLINILSNEKNNYIIEIEKNDQNQITNINFNNNKINKILSLSINEIQNRIKEIEKENKIYYIPYGLIYDNHLLNNLGPKIPYAVKQLGKINNNTYINIEEYGINNSMIEVILSIEIEIRVMLPFISDTIKVQKEILLENKIIQGEIPKYYGNVNSLLK